ncbi:MAG: FUSC family protein, partial [Mycobacterium sp.]
MLKVLTLPVVPDLAAVLRSLVGVLAVALVAWNWGPVGSGTAAAGAAAIAGVTALQDSPRGRIARVVAVSLLMAVAVLLGGLTSAYSALFVAVIALWCFGAAMLWALGAHAGLIAAVSGALMVIAPPVSPTLSSTVGAAAVVAAAGLLQAALFAVWPQRRWRVQREALTNAYRSLAADARRLADGGSVDIAGVDTGPLITLRAAFTQADGEAGRRPGEHRDWYGLPERIATTLTGLHARETGTEVFAAAADALDAVAETGRSARAAADDAMRRLD